MDKNITETKEINIDNSTSTINYIDLCSGIGGFRIAIEQFATKTNRKFKCILSADIKPDAIKTYNVNFDEKNDKLDIYTLDPKNIPAFDLLCAGFPCQPFSSAGNKKGFDDKRGGMIFKIIDICKHHKPKIVILENVSNLLTLNKGSTIQQIQRLFEDIGYKVEYKKLNSSDFGLPQHRERVYIVCLFVDRSTNENVNSLTNKNVDKSTNENVGELTNESVDKSMNMSIFDRIKTNFSNYVLKDIIDTSDKSTDIEKKFMDKIVSLCKKRSLYGCKIGDKRGGKNNIHSWDLGFNGDITDEEKKLMNAIMLERRKKHWALKKNIVWMDGMPLTEKEISSFYQHKNLSEMLKNLVSKKYLKLEKCKDLINGKRVYKEDSEVGYNICKGKLSFPISCILDPNNICPTLTATDSSKLAIIVDNDKIIRKLNVGELKKICGFPDKFIIPDSVDMYDLFGNMVTPPVIEAILDAIYD
jgi:DNA (cytosine-5)-methyltransferase 1